MWPRMRQLDRQRVKDIQAPIRANRAHQYVGLIELRPARFFERRIEYGMGHAWLVLKLGRYRAWFRVERAR